MGLLLKRIKKRTARGKSIDSFLVLTFGFPEVFDIAYSSEVHRRFVLNEIRFRTQRPGSAKTKASMTFEIKEAKRWRDAILRDAPLLKGFFAEEPQWREKILSWCQRIITNGVRRNSAGALRGQRRQEMTQMEREKF
jgi:hypothetical protein